MKVRFSANLVFFLLVQIRTICTLLQLGYLMTFILKSKLCQPFSQNIRWQVTRTPAITGFLIMDISRR